MNVALVEYSHQASERKQRRRAARVTHAPGAERDAVRGGMCRHSRGRDKLAFFLHSARIMKRKKKSLINHQCGDLLHVKQNHIHQTSDMRRCRLSLATSHLAQVVRPECAKAPLLQEDHFEAIESLRGGVSSKR
jgi:hypothetical protein